MRRVLIAFALLFGIVSSVHFTFKQEMTEKLDYCVSLLKQAKLHATGHGFGFHEKYFANLLSVVDQQRFKVKSLPENSTAHENDNWALLEVIVNIYDLVNKAVQKTYHDEYRKASVLYLSGMMHSNQTYADGLIWLVFVLIDQETLVATHPSDAETFALNYQYNSIEKTFVWSMIPTFEDHYYLINKVTKIVDVYQEKNRFNEAKALLKSIKLFNDLTVSLTKLFPISSKEIAREYADISFRHFAMRISLLRISSAEQTVKQALLNRIDVQEKNLKEAIAKFERRSAHFYAKILVDVQTQLNTVRIRAQALSDTVIQGDAPIGMVDAEVNDLERVVLSRTLRPSPYMLQKTDALYQAAMNAKDQRNVSQALVDKVIEIVNFEKKHASELVAYETRFDVKQQALYTQQTTLYWNLLQLIISDPIVPSPEKNEELAARAVRKIEALTGQGHHIEASMLQNELKQFIGNEKTMNKLLPVDETTTVQSYLEAANRHYLGRINIEALIAKAT